MTRARSAEVGDAWCRPGRSGARTPGPWRGSSDGLAPGWIAETAADWAWARVQPGSWAGLVGMRGWAPGPYTERTVGSLLAELVAGAGTDTGSVRD